MRLCLTSFCVGLLLVTRISSLELLRQISALAGVVGLFLCLLGLSPKFRTKTLKTAFVAILASSLGVFWHAHHSLKQLERVLPFELQGRDLRVEGRVISLAKYTGSAHQFQFQVYRTQPISDGAFDESQGMNFQGKILLSFYPEFETDTDTPAELLPGTELSLVVKLNRPHGYANPGVFDYEAFLFRNGILAKGYVRSDLNVALSTANRRSSIPSQIFTSVEALRFLLRERIRRFPMELEHRSLILALGLGDGSEINGETWEAVRASGTTHLLVVSGLHISLIALALILPARLLWCFIVFLRPCWGGRISRQSFVLLFALFGAGAFSLLAGWGLPARRAMIMLSVIVLAQLCNRRMGSLSGLLIALTLVLMGNPSAATGSGFWLSFMAVAALLFFGRNGAQQAENIPSFMSRIVWPQWVVLLVLSAPLLIFGAGLAILAPIINMIAIPFLTLFALPSALLAILTVSLPIELSAPFLKTADVLCGFLLSGIRIASNDAWLWTPSQSLGIATYLGLGLMSLLLLLPLARRVRVIFAMLLILGFWGQQSDSYENRCEGPDSLQIDLLDVGQGLSLLIRTRCHALLYDAGAKLGPDFDMGSAVIAPTLRSLGVRKLDRFVISHADNDHAGGAGGLMASIPTKRLMLGGDPKGYSGIGIDRIYSAETCHAGQSWRWDGVSFEVIAPYISSRDLLREQAQVFSDRNSSSCVIRVTLGEGVILLPGDVEASTERYLAARHRNSDVLNATVLIAPHHGSNTSSTYAFIKMVSPEFVLIPVGYTNAFGHPHPDVISRYSRLGYSVLATAESGMLSLRVLSDGGLDRIEEYRRKVARYWRPRPTAL